MSNMDSSRFPDVSPSPDLPDVIPTAPAALPDVPDAVPTVPAALPDVPDAVPTAPVTPPAASDAPPTAPAAPPGAESSADAGALENATGDTDGAVEETGDADGNESENTTGTQTFAGQIIDFAAQHPAAFGGICAGAGVTAALLAALIVSLIRRALRKSRKAKTPTGKITVKAYKLHGQGARKDQQDCFGVSPTEFVDKQGVLAVVADGMGGLEHGDQVSQAAASAALNGFFTVSGSAENVLLELLKKAVSAVDGLLGPGGLKRSGSTIVMGLLRDMKFSFVSVGDSRICLYRNGDLYKLNREHTYKYELAAQAVSGSAQISDVYKHPKKGGLTSYLGMGDIKYVDMPTSPIDLHPGDKLVLMTDGVYNALTDSELAAALSDSAPADAVKKAVAAKGYTNQDNYTAVILSVEDSSRKSERRK